MAGKGLTLSELLSTDGPTADGLGRADAVGSDRDARPRGAGARTPCGRAGASGEGCRGGGWGNGCPRSAAKRQLDVAPRVPKTRSRVIPCLSRLSGWNAGPFMPRSREAQDVGQAEAPRRSGRKSGRREAERPEAGRRGRMLAQETPGQEGDGTQE